MTATPMLDKARTDELTVREVLRAIRELRAITPDDMMAPYDFHASPTNVNLLDINGRLVEYAGTIEAALTSFHDDIKQALAEMAGA